MKNIKPTKKEIRDFLKKQQSLQFYKKTQKAFEDVFLSMSKKDFKDLTKDLCIVALHEGVLGQMMHFEVSGHKVKIIQLTIPNSIPIDVLKFVIAHELGHATQSRNWKKSDGNKLEVDADKKAEEWGFKRTKKIDDYIKKKWKKPYKC